MNFHTTGYAYGSTPPRGGQDSNVKGDLFHTSNGVLLSSSPPPPSSLGVQQHQIQQPEEEEFDSGGKRRRNKKSSSNSINSGSVVTASTNGVSTPTPPAKRFDATTTPTTIGAATANHSNAAGASADLVVLVTRTDLYDAAQPMEATTGQQQQQQQPSSQPPSDSEGNDPFVLHSSSSMSTTSSPIPGYPRPPIAPYQYRPHSSNKATNETTTTTTLAICRVPPSPSVVNPFWMEQLVFDKSMTPPSSMLTKDRSMTKYWNQRRRLFSRFDLGIQLDEQGWFSVTPEQIADHVAVRSVDLYRHSRILSAAPPVPVPPPTTMQQPSALPQQQQQLQGGMVVLDAFCGCGGNSIAFAKLDGVAQVICVDIDRAKLHRAANNAAIYQIPTHKLIFVECNVLFLLEHCYKNGSFILDQPIDTPEQAMAMMSAMPPPVATETSHGYAIGGIDMLPRTINAIFMDPPWGGVDYEVFGKNGYCLESNMRIPRPANQVKAPPTTSEGVTDGFFDTFCTASHNGNHNGNNNHRNKQERKAAFNCGLDENNCVNGAELLALAAAAATDALVIYDIPRNTSRTSLGQAALAAGYRGNCKLEEHYLNGRLKTVTAYFGTDWRGSLLSE